MVELRRTLNLGQCIFFGVGSILGAGIYTLLGKVAGWAGNLTWLSFLVASLAAFCTAFSYAELSASMPKAGGEYVYVKKAFGKRTGTALGLIISANGIISGATVSVGFAGYFSELLPISELIASLGIIGLLFFINVSGIKQSSTVNIIFTIIEATGLLFVIYAAIPFLGSVNYFELPEDGPNGFFTAAALGFFAYIGFEEIVKLAEETNDPEKKIPKALFIANGIVGVMYVLVAICAVSVIPWQQLGESDSPLADIVGGRFGATAVTAISIIALFSTANTILSNMLGSSRVLLNMSKEITWMKRLSFVSPKKKTPVAALVLILIVMCCFALIGKIETIARIANLFIFATFLFINVSVIVLRKKAGGMKRPYRIPGTIKDIPLVSIVGILLILLLLYYNVAALVKGVTA
jgi:basic amino acid/polyamine antiporter, APA family